jgi:hypothetical protein
MVTVPGLSAGHMGNMGREVRAGFGVGSARMNVMVPVSDVRATAT